MAPSLTKVHVEVEPFECIVQSGVALKDEGWKEWIWKNHKDVILAGMEIRFQSSTVEESLCREDTLSTCKHRLALLDKVAEVQRKYLRSEGPKFVYGCMLEGILDLTGSEYGFIGEVKREKDGTPYVQTHAATNIAWNEETQKFYEENADDGLKFYNMKTLFGEVVTTSKPVISNCPKDDRRAGGIPPGHPALNHFLGIPFFRDSGKIIGMVGLANKRGGYCKDDIIFLEPFTATCSNLIQAYWQIEENRLLIENLEEANRQIKHASDRRLKTFACMSHEIRTPLNAVLGLASMLAETEMTATQMESIQTIVSSGNLLRNIVNDVLDFATLESGKLAIKKQCRSLDETLTSCLSLFERPCDAKDCKFRAVFDASVPEFVVTDHDRLQQVLCNLVSNAVKFSKDGGEIEVHVNVLNEDSVPMTDGTSTSEEKHCDACTDQVEPSRFPDNGSLSCPRYPQENEHPESDASRVGHEAGTEATQCPFLRPIPATVLTTMNEGESDVACEGTSGQENDIESSCPFNKNHCQHFSSQDAREPTLTVGHLSRMAQEGNTEESTRPCSHSGALASEPAGVERCHRRLGLAVRDYGIGIRRENFSQLFKPFEQIDQEAETLYGGAGLGLAISAKLVTALGGSISVDSQLDKYTEFKFDIPLESCPVKAPYMPKDKLKESILVLLVSKSPHERSRVESSLRCYSIRTISCNTMEDLGDMVVGGGQWLNEFRQSVCIVSGELFQQGVFDKIAKVFPLALVIHGPLTTAKPAKCLHLRSIAWTLPARLLRTIQDAVKSLTEMQTTGVSIQPPSTVSIIHPKEAACTTESSKLGLRILIAEDNVINQKVLRRLLNRIGIHDIDIVDNGKKAVEKEAACEYDLVMMDLQMPVMDGVEACKLITSRQNGHPRAPVVFVTAHALPTFQKACEEAGGAGFLPKPCSLDLVRKHVEMLL